MAIIQKLPEAYGVELIIEQIQDCVGAISWVAKSMGEAQPTDIAGNIAPYVWDGATYSLVEPSDIDTAISFIDTRIPPVKAKERSSQWHQDIRLVFALNLDLINTAEGTTHGWVYTEKLIKDISTALSDANFDFILEQGCTIQNRISSFAEHYSHWTFDGRFNDKKYDAFMITFAVVYEC